MLPAPPSPGTPWPIPHSTPSSQTEPEAPVAQRRYDLAALIDLAETLNPETREAWNKARAAAAAAGVARSSYLPQLAIEALAGAQRTPLAAPSNLVPKGYFVSDTREFIPTLTAKWLLFDFGRRDAAFDRANAMTFVANVAFTGAHQKLVYTVSHDYFALGAAMGKLRAAREGLETAQIDNTAVSERHRRGVATSVDQARSDRQLAQSRFALVRAEGTTEVARFTLIADVGLPPGTTLDIADSAQDALPMPPVSTVDTYVAQALAQRPDVIAAQGKIDAAEAEVRAAKAEFRPTIAALGSAFENDGRLRSDGGPWSSVHRPGGAVFLQLSWTIFDGGARRSKLALAMAERDAAIDTYHGARDAAGKQVVEAFSALRTALAATAASAEVTRAATIAHDAALDAFRHGLATFDDLATEANALSQAHADEEDARANALTAAAALALATGGTRQ
ncbi:TolC family protein [Pinirhizobacter sp.]|uniref:TolC family protein n=1 Tax=Pinirhizobacter sp. TaxID=2950432 RepID=UPI002F3F395E